MNTSDVLPGTSVATWLMTAVDTLNLRASNARDVPAALAARICLTFLSVNLAFACCSPYRFTSAASARSSVGKRVLRWRTQFLLPQRSITRPPPARRG